MCEPFVTVDTSVPQRRIFIATECKNSLIHPLCVKNLQTHEEVEITNCQTSDYVKEVRLQLRNNVL